MKRSQIAFACASVVLFATTFFVFPRVFPGNDTPQLEGIAGLPELLGEKYHVHSGREDPLVTDNFFVSTKPLTFEKTNSLQRDQCGLNDSWDGIVWIRNVKSEYTHIESGFMAGHSKRFGNVLIAGDKTLMKEIEKIIRSR